MLILRKTARHITLLSVFFLLFSGSQCLADIWTGVPLSDTLTYDDSELVTSGWGAGTSFYYEVTRPIEDGPLHYKYIFTAATAPALSHLCIEVSGKTDELEAFDPENPMDYVNGPVSAYMAGTSSGDPGFPSGEEFWSIKFEDFGEAGPWTVEFDSWRNPMWGNFYAKGGNDSYAYNTGLIGGNDVIAVPNSSYVPVPGAVLLGILGLGAVSMKLRKFA